MNTITEKPKSWTTLVAELEIEQSTDFPGDKERSISAMIRGNNRGGIKQRFPKRRFSVTKPIVNDPITKQDVIITRVTRIV
jgi:hypothetical protein